MTKNASLHVVARDDHAVVCEINAPAVAAALTRKSNAMGEPVLLSSDVTPALVERICTALRCTSGLKFFRSEEGRWRVRAVLPERTIEDVLDADKVAAARPEVHAPVADTDTHAKGNCKCHRCHGSGRIPSSRSNGLCYRCKGKGYTTEIDRRRNASYAKHRKARIEAARRAADDLNRTNRVAAS